MRGRRRWWRRKGRGRRRWRNRRGGGRGGDEVSGGVARKKYLE